MGRQPWLPTWDGALYAANTDHHRRYDDRFLSTLPLRPTDRVLDLGCGSGDLTATVAALPSP
jgi:ubiquinone/menaquinone biosynthesis C-methylase UbiE